MRRFINLFTIAICLFSMNISTMSGETPEEAFLKKKELKLRNYLLEVKAGDRNLKFKILEEIYNDFDKSNYSANDKKLVDLVEYTVSEGSTRKEFENNLLINDFPEVRRFSVKVLGKIGGDQARQTLINVLQTDQNSNVKAEACVALALVGDNKNGDVLRALNYMYRTSYKPDPNLVFGVINAIKALAKTSNSNYSDAIYILAEIQHGDYNKAIRTAAYDAIKALNDAE